MSPYVGLVLHGSCHALLASGKARLLTAGVMREQFDLVLPCKYVYRRILFLILEEETPPDVCQQVTFA